MPELLPAGARHISAWRDDDLTCRVNFAAVESAEAEAEDEEEAKAEAKLDGGPSSVDDDIRRLEPVWAGGTLDPLTRRKRR